MNLTTAKPLKPWPYPRWVAHRGAGTLAPENTLAAFRKGAEYGYRMFECDAKLSADDVVFLMHDATLQRTTNGHGIGNIDATVIAQAPKLASFIPAMCERIAQALDISPKQVNVKAKTAEKMGPVGEGLSMEARAVVLIY